MEENKSQVEQEVKKDKKDKNCKEKLKKLEQELQEKEDKLNSCLVKIKELESLNLQSKADLINYRKRKDDEVALKFKYCNEDLLKELLPVIDNFERAIMLDDNVLDDKTSKFLSGFKMIYSHMRNILENFGVKEIECLGKKYDANYETSVFMDNDPKFDDEVVLDVLQKGYTYNDKLLRSASVKINKVDKNNNIENSENKEGNDKNE